MKKVIFSQILAGNGVTNFSGLFDENFKLGANPKAVADNGEEDKAEKENKQ